MFFLATNSTALPISADLQLQSRVYSLINEYGIASFLAFCPACIHKSPTFDQVAY